MRKIVFILLLIAVQLATGALAATYYVDSVNGSNGNLGTSPGPGNAWKNISYAAGVATNGDTINVAPGNYGTPEGEVFPINIATGETFTGPGPGSPAIITGPSAASTPSVILRANSTLQNFTVWSRNAYSTVVPLGSNFLVNNCIIYHDDGDALYEASGVYLDNKTGTAVGGKVSNCTIYNFDWGVKMLISAVGTNIVTIESNYIYDNDLNHIQIANWKTAVDIKNNILSGCPVAAGAGAGAIGITGMAEAAEVVTISQNTFADNKIGIGNSTGATACLIVRNNIFCGDDDLNKTAVAASRMIYAATTTDAPTNSNNLFWNYGQCFYNTTDGGSSVYAFPIFVDATAKDYRLHSSSPALGAGVGGINIGSYIGAGEAATVYRATSYVNGSTGVDDASHGASADSPYASVTYANKYTYGTMNISAGTYSTTESITLGQGKTFTGAGMGSTTLECTTNNTTVVCLPQNGTLNNLDLKYLGAPGDGGLYISFPNVAVNSCGIYSSAGTTGTAIYVDSNGGYLTSGKILSCEVFDCDTAWLSPVTGGSNAGIITIEGCTIYDCTTYAIRNYSYASTLDIARNLIRDRTASTNGAISLRDIPAAGSVIIRNNTLVKNKIGIVTISCTNTYSRISAYNNIISSQPDGTTAPIASSVGFNCGAMNNIQASYNDVYNNATNYTNVTAETGSITATAEFTAIASNDYTLTSPSPCIGTGLGSLDMGAFPYIVPAPVLTSIAITDTGGFTNDSTPSISIVSSGSPTHVAFSCDSGSHWSDWIAYNDTITSFDMTNGAVGCSTTNELKTITAKLKNGSGQESSTNSDTTYYDNAGPTGSIANGSGNPTNDKTPILNLTLVDTGVGTVDAQMGFCGDDSTWTDWGNYATPKIDFDIKPGSTAYGCSTSDGAKTVYVRYKDSLGNIGSSYNTGEFILDTTPPTVEVTSPNGGGTYKAGTIQTITWTATDEVGITGIGLFYSTNEVLVTIATGEANDGSYTWLVPNINSTEVKVRVLAQDTAGNQGFDESNAVFTIIPIPAGIAVNSLGEDNTKDDYITLREAVLISNGGTGAGGVNRTLSDLEKAAVYSGTFTGSADDWTISGGVGSGIADTIAFSVAGTIETTTVIAISDDSTTINGGFAHDVVIHGADTSTNDIFSITSNSNIIKGLVIQNGRYGIYVNAGDSNVIQNNYIGVNASASAAVANGTGVYLYDAAQDNIVGTDGDGLGDSSEGNIISGNSSYAVRLYHTATTNTGNIIAGNYIGVGANGATAILNGIYGVYIQGVNGVGPTANYVGVKGSLGGAASMKNVISGNTAKPGVRIDHADANYIMGNYLGINAAGTAASANSHGVYLYGGSDNNIIGTNGDGVNDTLERNVISGNTTYAIIIIGSTATYKCTGNIIAGNYIGLNAAGAAAVANARGILLYTYSDHTIVGTNSDGNNDAAEANVVSGNTNQGIYITRSSDNTVAGNLVGLDATGVSAIANATGIYIVGDSSGAANNNIIGTNGDGVNDSGERNIVSGNSYGVFITASASGNIATGNRIAGNYIGTNISGTAAVPNSVNGVRLLGGAQGNYIGTNGDGVNDAAEANIISGNVTGVYFGEANTNANWVSGNTIGLGPDGSTVLANTGSGILLTGAEGAKPSANIIGVDDSKAAPQNMRNVVSGNSQHGILIGTCDGNIVAGNFVGLDATGTIAKGNGQNGIYLNAASNNNIVGTDGDGNSDDVERNVASGQTAGYGIAVYGSSSSSYPVNNRVAGNYVGTNVLGTSAIANNTGVLVGQYAASNIIGFDGTGTEESERNIISGNTTNGIYFYAAGTNSNEARSNWIGLSSDGASDLGNGTHGIYLSNTPSYNLISLNTIAFNGDAASEYGVYLDTDGTDFNKISQNSIYSNQAGGIGIADGANEAINAPASLVTAKGVMPNTVDLSGACDVDASGTTIEVFQSVSSQGKTFIGSAYTTDSSWLFTLSGPATVSGETYVVTATNSKNDSSVFSSQIAIPYYSWGALYTSPVGSAEAWIWTNPMDGTKVMSGSAESWSWQTWTSGSGRKVPQGSAEAWQWGSE